MTGHPRQGYPAGEETAHVHPYYGPRAELKRKAAIEAADMVKEGMVVGLGSGSTSAFMIEELGRRWAEGYGSAPFPHPSVRPSRRARMGSGWSHSPLTRRSTSTLMAQMKWSGAR